jgi:hypothetical protein
MYRTLLVAINWTNPSYVEHPVTFGEAAQAIPPQIVIFDQVMLNFIDETNEPSNPYHSLNVQIRVYMLNRQARLLNVIQDPYYGRFEIYQLEANMPVG